MAHQYDEDALLRAVTLASAGGTRILDDVLGQSDIVKSTSGLRSRKGSLTHGGGPVVTPAVRAGSQRKNSCPAVVRAAARCRGANGLLGALGARTGPGPDALERLPPAFFELLDLQDLHGRTALHYAVLKGSAQITYMLLCLGADRRLRDNPPQDPGAPGPAVQRPGPPPSADPDAPPRGLTAREYAELHRGHDPYGKVVAVFEEAARLLEHKPDYPHQYLHEDTKWLPIA